jgi:translation initiation factor IF-1
MESRYFAALPTDEIGNHLQLKVDGYFQDLYQSAKYQYWKKSYQAYYGGIPGYSGPGIKRVGERGEVTSIVVNIYRNLIQHLLVMVTSERPALELRAINSDSRSLAQTMLGEGIIEYYMREKRLGRIWTRAIEKSLVFDESYITMEWDPNLGQDYGVDPMSQQKVKEGDISYRDLSPLRVVKDVERESDQQDWYNFRYKVNKFDIAARFPELSAQVLACDNLDNKSLGVLDLWHLPVEHKNDDVWFNVFMHKKTDALPEGRLVHWLTGDIVLLDSPLPYKNMPVYRCSPADWLERSDGYTPGYDVIALQEALNELATRVLSNNMTFAMQNVQGPKQADIDVTQLPGGLNYIGVDQKQGEIKPLQLTASPPETYKFLDLLEKWGDLMMGLNSVAKGNPEGALKGASGSAMALLAAQAIKFSGGLQMAANDLLESVGTGTIEFLQTFAQTKRMATIAGKSKRAYMKEFSSTNLDKINRAIVQQTTALSKTTSGRLEMARDLLSAQILRTGEEYMQVVMTGNLEPLVESDQSTLMLVKVENESLRDGKQVRAIISDRHDIHIREHDVVTNDPELRMEEGAQPIVEAALMHKQEHIDLWKSMDPQLAGLLGIPPYQQPMMPPGMMPPPPGTPEGAGAVQDPAAAVMDAASGQGRQPNMPNNALTGEEFNQVDGGLPV